MPAYDGESVIISGQQADRAVYQNEPGVQPRLMKVKDPVSRVLTPDGAGVFMCCSLEFGYLFTNSKIQDKVEKAKFHRK